MMGMHEDMAQTLEPAPTTVAGAHKNLAEALAAFQGEAPKLHKAATANAGSFSYRYVDLADIVDAIQPLMLKHGLSFSSFPCVGPDGKPALRYKLGHTSGDCESDVMSLMVSKVDAQAHGSAISYARRYALTAVLNLVADADDDGRAAKVAQERVEQERDRANGVGSPPRVTAADVAEIKAALKDLTPAQIQLAFGAVGLDGTKPFGTIPREKAAPLVMALGRAGGDSSA